MVAIRMKDPEEIPEHVGEMIMPLSNHKVGEGIRARPSPHSNTGPHAIADYCTSITM
jgi:hypothetical protein